MVVGPPPQEAASLSSLVEVHLKVLKNEIFGGSMLNKIRRDEPTRDEP